MEYSLSLQDITLLVKKNIKIVILFALIFAVVMCGYKMLKDKRSAEGTSAEESQKSIQKYNEWIEDSKKSQEVISDELIRSYNIMQKHPLMSLNPDDCTTRYITFTLDIDPPVSRVDTVRGWLNGIDYTKLFGTDNKLVKQFRNDLVTVGGEYGEIIVTVFDIKEYQLDKVAKKIINIVTKKAKDKGLRIISTQNNKINGFSQSLFDKQDAIRNDITRIVNELNTIKNYEMTPPTTEGVTNGFNIKGITLFGIAGIILGIILAVLLILFRTIKKGKIISCKQIDEFFQMEKLGIAETDKKGDIKLINAVVRALTNDINKVMLVSNDSNIEFESTANELDQNDDIRYVYGTVNMEDVESIEELKSVDKVIVPIAIGESTHKDVNNVIKWSQKFKKDILGYIVVDY